MANRVPRRLWTIDEERALVQCMSDSVGEGLTIFPPRRLKVLLDQKLPGNGFLERQIESKVKMLKHGYYSMKEMLNNPIFGWDEENHMVVGPEEAFVWWFQEHPHREWIIRKHLHIFMDLEEIFSAIRNLDEEVPHVDNEEIDPNDPAENNA